MSGPPTPELISREKALVAVSFRADTHSTPDPAVETPIEGRQGFLGRPVLAVLIGGLVLAGVAWIVVHYTAD